jgi:hypothetical protein
VDSDEEDIPQPVTVKASKKKSPSAKNNLE